MKAFPTFVVLILASSFCLHAQRLADVFDPNFLNKAMFDQQAYQQIAGSPYVGDDFYEGVVVVKSGKEFPNIPMRYNSYEDALLVKMDDGVEALLDPKLVGSFRYQGPNGEINFRAFRFEGSQHFYRVIYDGNTKLVVRHIAILGKSTNSAGGYGSEDKQGQAFNSVEKYFIIDSAGSGVQIKTAKKSVLEALGSNSTLENFAKKEKIKFCREDDLYRLLEYYDSISSR